MMKKKDSEAWKLAKRRARRKGVNTIPIELSPCGAKVKFRSLIRGNEWWLDLPEIKALAR